MVTCICETESLCCTPAGNSALLTTLLLYKIKIGRKPNSTGFHESLYMTRMLLKVGHRKKRRGDSEEPYLGSLWEIISGLSLPARVFGMLSEGQRQRGKN